jgi:hypothetical protein
MEWPPYSLTQSLLHPRLPVPALSAPRLLSFVFRAAPTSIKTIEYVYLAVCLALAPLADMVSCPAMLQVLLEGATMLSHRRVVRRRVKGPVNQLMMSSILT